MTFTENIANVLEVCKLKNLTVYKFIMELCVVLRSQLLSQVQVELEEYMQMCMVRAPFLDALKSGTVDEATFRVSVMGTVMAEWRVNRRVRQQTAMLQREIAKRQAEEQPVPCCSPAWIYQDFPSLLSETKAESLPISFLCDLILKRYDLTKDKEFRDLHCEVESELQKQQPDHVDQVTQNDSQNNQSLPTTCAPRESTEPNSLPMRADWFRHYQPAQPYTDMILSGQTGPITVAQPLARRQYNAHTTNFFGPYNGQEAKRHMLQCDPSRRNTSIDSRGSYMYKTAGNRYYAPEVQRHSNHVVHASSTTKTAPTRDTTVSSGSRKCVRPHSQPYKQAHRHVPTSKKIIESAAKKTSSQTKDLDLKIDKYLSRVCPNQTKTEHTKTKSPEFSSAHMGGLVIKIAKKPKSVQVIEPKQPKKQLNVKERKRQAFLTHVERIQKKLKKNMKADAQTNQANSPTSKATDTDAQTKQHNLGTSSSAIVTNKDSSRKRKAIESSLCSSIRTKCARLETGSAEKDSSCKRKATESSMCSSIQNKCARLETGSAEKDSAGKRKARDTSLCSSIQSRCARLDTRCAVKDSSHKRKASDASLCSSIQSKCARLDTASAVKAFKRHVIKICRFLVDSF